MSTPLPNVTVTLTPPKPAPARRPLALLATLAIGGLVLSGLGRGTWDRPRIIFDVVGMVVLAVVVLVVRRSRKRRGVTTGTGWEAAAGSRRPLLGATVGLAVFGTALAFCGNRLSLLAGHPTGEPSKAEIQRRLADIRPGEEREMGDGVFLQMHRIQATEPVSGGWQRATSTEGGFSVELPLAFNDFRGRFESADHVPVRSYSIGAKSPGLVAWTATCLARKDGKLDPAAGSPGQDKTEVKGTSGLVRTVVFDDMICLLIVEAQGNDPLPPASDSERFLRSLTRTGKPIW